MSRKFFSLIKGDNIHISPKAKFLPAGEFSVMLEASEVLDLVKSDAETYKLQEAEECEKLKAQAQKAGFEEGFAQWTAAIANLEHEIKKVRIDLEKIVSSVALKAAKKIVGREIEQSEDAIVDIVASSLKSVAQHKKITIYVNKKELSILESNRPRIKQLFESLESLSIRERADIAPGGCVIETEGGIINAQLENQWRILEKAFETLTKHKAPIL